MCTVKGYRKQCTCVDGDTAAVIIESYLRMAWIERGLKYLKYLIVSTPCHGQEHLALDQKSNMSLNTARDGGSTAGTDHRKGAWCRFPFCFSHSGWAGPELMFPCVPPSLPHCGTGCPRAAHLSKAPNSDSA